MAVTAEAIAATKDTAEAVTEATAEEEAVTSGG